MNKFLVWYGTLASMLYDIIHEQQVQNEEFKFSYFEFSKNFALTAKDFPIDMEWLCRWNLEYFCCFFLQT